MSDGGTKLNIVLESDTKLIGNIINSTVSLCKIYCKNKDILNISIPLILDELLRNAIYHGNKSIKKKIIDIKIEINKTELIMTIKDEGTGFNFKKMLKEQDATSKINRSNHGRGILLVNKYSKSLKYSLEGRKVKVVVKYDK